MRDDNEVINALRQCEAAIATWVDVNPPSAGFSVGQMGAMKSLRTALTNARAVLDRAQIRENRNG